MDLIGDMPDCAASRESEHQKRQSSPHCKTHLPANMPPVFSSIRGVTSLLFFNAQELVIFGQPLRSAALIGTLNDLQTSYQASIKSS